MVQQPLSRRAFFALASSAALGLRLDSQDGMGPWLHPYAEVRRLERTRVLAAANRYMHEPPKTITSAPAPRSAGGLHDYYSEGDYWWPNPKDPPGPYIRRDGESNPDNFTKHRELLIRLSIQMPALTAAWLLTGKRDYAAHAIAHLRSWFVDPATRMNPNLEYAQAIHGIDAGRSIGIIDTVHLAEVARAALILQRASILHAADQRGTEDWFSAYLRWLTTAQHGLEERDKRNNHGSCWLLQAACFAGYTGDRMELDTCRTRMEDVIFPNQIAANGSFPLELARTKPYSYSLFNLDVLGICAQVLSTPLEDVWTYRLPDGRGLRSCFQFLFPYIRDKKRWPYRHDVQFFDDLPVRQPSLLFAGLAYDQPDYLALWARLNPDSTVPEVIRNHPVRQPLLWLRG